MLKHYLQEMFEPTLLYGLSLAVLGIAASAYYGHFSLLYAILIILGTVLAQMSANVISDYFDYSSGLDRELARNKSDNLSGGSSLIADGMIKPSYALALGVAIFLCAGMIGAYLVYVRIQVLPILVIAALSIFTYSKYVKKVPFMSEQLCTLNYVLISFGSFIVVSGIPSLTYALIFSFVPAGIMLGGNALFVNEVPDKDIDGKYGIKHSAVMLKTGKRIGAYYLGFQALAYMILLAGIAIREIPSLSLAGLIVLPVTAYVFNGLYNEDRQRYGEYLRAHTWASFAFALILSASYIIALRI